MFPVPSRLFWLSVLVALDGSVGTPAHSSKVKAEGQDGHGTSGQADAHERRSNQTSRNRHAIQNHLIHRRKSFLIRFLSTPIMIHEQASKLYIQTPTPQTEHNQQPTPTRQTNKPAPPTLSRRHRPPPARREQGQASNNEPTRSPPTLVARRGEKTNRRRRDTNEARGQRARGDRKSETGTGYGVSRHGDTMTREATQEHEAKQDGKKQASKYRPAQLIAGTGRRTIRSHTRTQGTRTDAGGQRGENETTRTRMMKQARRDEDETTGGQRSKQGEAMTTGGKITRRRATR